jgi:hypothetical protein
VARVPAVGGTAARPGGGAEMAVAHKAATIIKTEGRVGRACEAVGGAAGRMGRSLRLTVRIMGV